MCGIVGVWWPPGIAPIPAALQVALNRLRHRGPDGQGELTSDGVSIAMRRLSIMDLTGGDQPRFDEGKQVAVVCNGEIYNAPELARELAGRGHTLLGTSDVEPIPHLWEEHGVDALRRLRGMFALALFDRRARRLVLARDRFGKKPLYWLRSANGGLAFASELKALRPLAEALGFPLRRRAQAIYDYLSLGVVPQPGTVWEGVHCVPPASWLAFDGTRIEEGRYWELSRTPKLRLSAREAEEAVHERVAEAVRIRLRADVPVGTFLSGGIDSGVVTWEASRAQAGLTAFTVAFKGEPAWDESEDAAASARHIGVRHQLLPLDVAPRALLEEVVAHWDQPFADPSAIPSLAVSRLAREHVTVILNGDGGDELFAGYRRYLAALGGSVLAHLPPAAAGSLANALARRERRSALGLLARWLRGAGTSPAERYLTWTTDLLLEPTKRASWIGPACRPTEEWLAHELGAGLDGLDAWLDADRRINLLSDLLVKMDMATMAASLEGRSPLLDHEVAELAARLPVRRLFAGGRLKGILRRAYAHALPPAVLRGKKRGFEVPLARWLDGDLRPLAQDALGDPAARLREYLAPDLIARGLDPAARPFLRYTLLVLELWLRRG